MIWQLKSFQNASGRLSLFGVKKRGSRQPIGVDALFSLPLKSGILGRCIEAKRKEMFTLL